MLSTIKYGIVGASGRLGGEVKNIFSENSNELVFSYSLEGEFQTDTPKVLIDCSLPDVLDKTISYAKEFCSPLVIATTGLSNDQLQLLKELSKTIAVVQSYNYSIGVQVMLKLVKLAKEKLPDWDVEIEETHHRFKKDKPSGTAKMIQKIFEGRQINTSSLRLGNIPGDHAIHFGGLGEILTIKHHAISRRTFAEGIIKAAEFVLKRKSGFYSFADVI